MLLLTPKLHENIRRARFYISFHPALRLGRILEDHFSRLRDAIKTQDFFQDLESWEPRPSSCSTDAPAGERNFELPRTKKSKSLKKIALRAPRSIDMTIKNRDFGLDNGKTEDPPKMTHSISDFSDDLAKISSKT